MIGPVLLLVLAQAPAGPPPYWQQRLEYDITATLDEAAGTLSGRQRVRYHNNSPDTLRSISFHLYLNAFRPGSRWSDADSAEGRRRFNDLKDPDYGFNRVANAVVDGRALTPVYPFAPDSTIVRYALPAPIAPGDSFDVSLDWAARPSTVARRQGRRGRHYDFAQWYPRVVAYDRFGWAEHPLYPAGEFYGDFGEFRVTLDVPADQVVGATGVPVCGDPGWERANRVPARPVALAREAYGAPSCGGLPAAAAGRKTMLWVARDVHHFVMSMDPAYLYEGGGFGDALVHVLYRPGDERSWGGGIAVERTETALRWLDGLFGKYPWPQITNVHRIDGGGTEFPMMVHNGSAGLGLILHEVGHNYLMGILANNEWREGFLDEGFTSFQTTWFEETQGASGGAAALDSSMVLSDVDGWSEPTSLVSERYRDFGTYNAMIYDRGELFYHQLRAMVGDSVMRAILRTFYDRWKLKHVDEAAFRAVAEAVSHRDLSTFFGQWLHGTALYDYAVGKVKTERRKGTGDEWVTRVEVVRKSPGIFPVDVVVRGRGDSSVVRAEGSAEREWVSLTTRERPGEVEIDPWVRSHDWNMLDNRKKRGLLGFKPARRTEVYFDRLFFSRSRRDRMTLGLVPAIWYNDESGVVLGARARSDYLGRFEQNQLLLSVDTRRRNAEDNGLTDRVGFYARIRNPVRLGMAHTRQTLEGYSTEGRAGLAARAERQTNRHRGFGAQTWVGGGIRWLVTTATRYLDPALWDGGGTVEAESWIRSEERRGAWTVRGGVSAAGGVEYRNRGTGLSTEDAYDAQPYLRLTGEATARRDFGRYRIGFRGYAGWVESSRRPLKQRQLFVAGADPYQQFSNPFLRSRGALLAGADVHYHMPGGGNVRGLAAGTSATRLVAVSAEADRAVFSRAESGPSARTRTRLFGEIRLAAFGDAALGNGDVPLPGGSAALVADAGAGIRIGHRIGSTPFITRFDFPVVVSRPRLAAQETGGIVRFRWVVSAEAAF